MFTNTNSELLGTSFEQNSVNGGHSAKKVPLLNPVANRSNQTRGTSMNAGLCNSLTGLVMAHQLRRFLEVNASMTAKTVSIIVKFGEGESIYP